MTALSVDAARAESVPMKLLILMLPLELVVAQLAHGLFKHVLPAPSLLLHPLLAVAVMLFALRRLRRTDLLRQDTIVVVAVAMLAFPCVYHLVQGNGWDLRFLLLGVGSLLVGLLLSQSQDAGFVTRPLAVGLIVWCVAIVLAFIADTFQLLDFHEGAKAYSLDQLILAMRYPNSIDLELYYPVLTGNWNKASNIIVLSCMLMTIAIYRDRAARSRYLVAMAAMAIVNLLSYSRGGLLVAAGLGVFNLVLLVWIRPADRRVWVLAACLMMLPLVMSLLLPAMRLRWFDMSSMDERVGMIEAMDLKTVLRGHFGGAFDVAASSALANAWHWLVAVVQQALVFLLGIGVGTYGEQMLGGPFAGTHNMLLDMFIAGGLVQVAGLLLLFGYVWLVVIRQGIGSVPQMIGGMSLVAVLVLSFREFDLNYLGVSALPALLLGWFIGEALGGSAAPGVLREERA